jgi:ornithine carbamoyltransferase
MKEDILVEALPYISKYEGKTFVIKYGGAAMTDPSSKEAFAKDVTLLKKLGINVVIVHGGGKQITELADKLGLESSFVGGHRYTTPELLDIVVMSLSGSVNKEIVGLINLFGGRAVGLTGVDHTLIKSKRFQPDGKDIGLVGEVESVNTAFIESLMASGAMPVIAPLGVGENGDIHNINADVAAAAIAAELKAEKLFYLTDTNGIMVDGELIPTLTNARAQQLIHSGVITGGMIPKVQSAFNALQKGVKKIHLINGASKHALLLEIFTNEGVGTQIIREEKVFGNSFAAPSLGVGAATKPSHLLDLKGLTKQDLEDLFALADHLKANPDVQPLKGKSIAMIFEKPSLRTRVSFEIGIAELGGKPVCLTNEAIGLGSREAVSDIAKVLGRYSDAIIARLYKHSTLEELAAHGGVPVVNALTDLSHPCQILADLYTIYQHGKLHPGMKVVFIGDGNNVVNSWLEAAAIYPMHFVLACPNGYEPDPEILKYAIEAGISTIEIMDDPRIAADSADVLYTDVWTSMGQEEESEARRKVFAKYQINRELVRLSAADSLVMHCLPAHRQEEITAEAMDSKHSVIFDQAENRLHIQKAVLATLLGYGSHHAVIAGVNSQGLVANPTNNEQIQQAIHN